MAEHIKKEQAKPDKKTYRTRKITFRLSESEYAQIADDLSVCGLSISSLVRKRLLRVRVASRADLAGGKLTVIDIISDARSDGKRNFETLITYCEKDGRALRVRRFLPD